MMRAPTCNELIKNKCVESAQCYTDCGAQTAGPHQIDAIGIHAGILLTRRLARMLFLGDLAAMTPGAEQDALRRVVELDPDGAAGAAANAMIYRANFAEGIRHSDRAMKLDPQNLAALLIQAQHLMIMEGKVEEALQLYDQALKLYPDDSSTNMGRVIGVHFYLADFRKMMGWGAPVNERWRQPLADEQKRAIQKYLELTEGSPDDVRRWLLQATGRPPR